MESGKKMRAPTKEQVYHDKNTYKHKFEQSQHKLKQAESELPKWISVNERLPDNDDTVALLMREDDGYTSHGYGHYSSYTDDLEVTYNPYKNTVLNYEVTHWVRLPCAI